MTAPTYHNDITVKLIRHCASDESVIQAAQVSAKGENNPDTVPERLIKALARHKHGSPFEHNMITMYVEAPIFVIREWQRHRMGSFNEMSGRYTTLEPKFYIPSEDRNVSNAGTKMEPDFSVSNDRLNALTWSIMIRNSYDSWYYYEALLEDGVANEVARMVLPLNIYTQMYWTVNARSLMNFISLRVESEDSAVKSYPQYEIQMGAEKVEAIFAELMPISYEAFLLNGRVAP